MEPFGTQEWRNRNKGRWLRLHPLSGASLLFLDNLFFGVNALTAGFAMPIAMALAFLTTFVAIGLVQRKLVGESRGMSLLKAFTAGIVAGLPFSLAGTTVGAIVLLSAGLSRRPKLPGNRSNGI